MYPAGSTAKEVTEIFLAQLAGEYPPEEIRNFVYILFEHYLKWPRTRLHSDPGEMLSAGDSARFFDALDRLKKHEPVQYITGSVWFRNAGIRVRPGVLIPRPETEQLVDLVIRENRAYDPETLSFLDAGTGSGCIAIALKMEFPQAAVYGSDTSEAALGIARENASLNKVTVDLIRSDLTSPGEWERMPSVCRIVCNPPYIPESEKKRIRPNVLEYEPASALFVPDEDPLRFYRALAEFARMRMLRPGILYAEINEDFGEAVRNLLEANGFAGARIEKDLNGKDRFAVAALK